MSSSAYSTALRPEPRLRHCVLWSGALLTAVGALIILVQPLAPALRLPAAIGWAFAGTCRLVALAAAYRSYCRIRIEADGMLSLEAADGSRRTGSIGPGSVVLERIAWLRIVVRDRGIAGELLRGDARESDAWRRFQVIWRHLGSAG